MIPYIEGTSIDDTWRQLLTLCWHHGIDYKIERGSYKGEIRRQLPQISFKIQYPWSIPLAPIMPPNSGFCPTDEEKINDYFVKYLLSDELEKNEEYTYGSYITPQLNKVIQILNESEGNTNQACIAVCNEESIELPDPPCLRHIQFIKIDDKLAMSIFFRSWDLVCGLPQNLGGLQLLKEYMLSNLTFKIEDGPIYGYSSGLHIYSQYFDVIRGLILNG